MTELLTDRRLRDVAVTGKWTQLNMQGIFHQVSKAVDREGESFSLAQGYKPMQWEAIRATFYVD